MCNARKRTFRGFNPSYLGITKGGLDVGTDIFVGAKFQSKLSRNHQRRAVNFDQFDGLFKFQSKLSRNHQRRHCVTLSVILR